MKRAILLAALAALAVPAEDDKPTVSAEARERLQNSSEINANKKKKKKEKEKEVVKVGSAWFGFSTAFAREVRPPPPSGAANTDAF